MKIEKLRELGFNDKEIKEHEIDAIEFIEHAFFSRKEMDKYREQSIKFCIDNNISFHNTQNNSFEMMEMFTNLICPKCGFKMKSDSGSGTGDVSTRHFKCKDCGVEGSLTIPTNTGIRFIFKEDDDE